MKEKIEPYIMWGIIAFSALIFVATPAHPANPSDFALEQFIDNYLFGNGYYHPEAYPLAAKATNSVSTILAFFCAVAVSIWKWDWPHNFHQATTRHIVQASLFSLVLLVFFLWLSTMPQEMYDRSGSKNFLAKPYFQNTPFLFLTGIGLKSSIIYVFTRYFGIFFSSFRK